MHIDPYPFTQREENLAQSAMFLFGEHDPVEVSRCHIADYDPRKLVDTLYLAIESNISESTKRELYILSGKLLYNHPEVLKEGDILAF